MPHNFVVVVFWLHVGVYLAVFLLLFVRRAVLSFLNLSQTDVFKYWVYLAVFLIVWILNSDIPFPKNSSGHFAMKIASPHSFVLLMVFIHWPYQYDTEEFYRHPDEAKDVHDLMESDQNV
jgi:hypothetical protein